jgi:hypothetical protein
MESKGRSCAAEEPCAGRAGDETWNITDAVVNQALMGVMTAVGAVAIARYRARKLLIYIPAVVAFLTWWRRYVCARCQYYGRECSTLLGVATARMMPRDETAHLDRRVMSVDLAMIGALALMPVRQVLKSPVLALAYLLSGAAGLSRVLLKSCGVCGNEFCPMKDLREMIVKE